MSEGSTAPRIVLVGTDFSEASGRAIAEACRMASADAELHVLHVGVPRAGKVQVDIGDEREILSLEGASDRLKQYVRELAPQLRGTVPLPTRPVTTHIGIGDPAEQIAQLAADIDADLVVVATHGRRGLRRLILGSVAEAVVRLCGCSVHVVRPKDHPGSAEALGIAAPAGRAQRGDPAALIWSGEGAEGND